MKEEFKNNLTEPFETDDLGIKAAMEGVEPLEGARERMLQNIMKKAAAVQAPEGVKAVSEEAPKAEILSIGAAKEAAKNSGKKQKGRWKLYVPMLVAAGLIVTVGIAFFSVYGIGKLGKGNSASDMSGAPYADEREAAGPQEGPQTDGMKPANEMPDVAADVPTGAAELVRTEEPREGEENHFTDGMKNQEDGVGTGAEAVPTDVMPDSPGSQQSSALRPEGQPYEVADATDEWSSMTTVRAALSAAVDGMEVVEVSEGSWGNDSITVSSEGHEYTLQFFENGRLAWELAEGTEVEEVVKDGENHLTLYRVTTKTFAGWAADWSLNGADWYHLRNLDDAPQNEVWEVIQKMMKNAREAAK